MPLSEDEQRILREIEQQLHRDPNFARELSPARVASRRSLVLSLVGGLLAVAICVLLLGVSPYLAFGAFIAAVAAVVVAERHLRAIGDEALRHVANLRRNGAGPRRDAEH
jgi:Protein of unknown function (DUF3040)